MSQTEKYYRKYRKYKKQYLYYKQYLGGGAEARQDMTEEKKRGQELREAARLKKEERKVNEEEDKATTMGADGAAGVEAEETVEEQTTEDEQNAAEDGRAVAEEEQNQQQQLHQDQVASKKVQGLMMQKEGLDIEIEAALNGIKFDEIMATAHTAELKGDIQAYQQNCQQLANDVKTGVAQVPGIVKGLARTIGTHERQESGQYTLSKRGDKIEGMVLKQVDRFAGGDAELGKKIYEDCKQEIHHEVGALINEDKQVKKLTEIRKEEAKKNQAMDQRAAAADQKEETT